MAEQKISLLLINEHHQKETIYWPLNNCEYVEQLIHEVLEKKSVKPIYRILFGLKSVGETMDVWLPPNLNIKIFVEETKNDFMLELRVRFIPSCYPILNNLDRAAFDIIFAQLRNDFITTKFNDDKRSLILLNDAVLGLIATDALRYCLEKHLTIDEFLKSGNTKDFIPNRAIKWQHPLVNYLARYADLEPHLRTYKDYNKKDLDQLKSNFINMFLSEVSQDYGVEIYKVEHMTFATSESTPMQLRVRYHRTDDESFCYIEFKPIKKKQDWEQLCDIETISHITLYNTTIQIARLNGAPMCVKFDSSRHSESFVSCVDGYYRLMRKWNIHLCREIFSPELVYLRRIGCHGPIGCATSKIKLGKDRRQGVYLIRKCMDFTNRYLIDIIVSEDSILTIDVDFDPATKTFKISDFNVDKDIAVSITEGLTRYNTIKNLIRNVSIWLDDGHGRRGLPVMCPLLPDDYDDYPTLMLCISKRKLRELVESEGLSNCSNAIKQNNFIAIESIKVTGKELAGTNNNGLVVKLADLGDDRKVVVKFTVKDLEGLILDPNLSDRLAYFYHYPGQKRAYDNRQLVIDNVSQLWTKTWVFIKHQFIAETIGVDSFSSLVQEYYSDGPLDKYLKQNSRTTSLFKLTIGFQLAQALVYLRDKQLIHGKIRCHNLLIKQTNPVHVVLADPLGPFDAIKDQAFIPTNYCSIRGKHDTKQYDHSIDVWAFGTTLWQIYNNGLRPPEGEYACCALTIPKDCSKRVWDLIEPCWLPDPQRRPSPDSLYRDLSNLIDLESDLHEYNYIQQDLSQIGDESSSTLNCCSVLSYNSTNMTHVDVSASFPTTNTTEIRNSSKILESPTSRNFQDSHLYRMVQPGYREAKSFKAVVAGRFGQASSYDKNASSKIQTRLKAPWKSIIGFKFRSHAQGAQSSSYKASYNCSSASSGAYCSRLSTSWCSTTSGSGLTKMTDVSDHHTIMGACSDRSVWLVDSNRLELGPEIGRGTSGVVMKGVLSDPDGLHNQVVAVKRLDTECLDFNLSKLEDLRREFDILKNLKHKNIVQTLGYVEESYMMVIFEYMPLGSLLSYLMCSQHEDIHTLPLAKYAHDIAQGMEYLENMKIVHRDLALRNILAKSPDEVKICDFGLAQFLGSSSHYTLKTERPLPLRWYAPEALTNWTFTHKTDVWSYGIVLWEIYSRGASPQYTGTYAELPETLKHERLPKPARCPEHMYHLMLKCWAYEPEERDTFAVISERLTLD